MGAAMIFDLQMLVAPLASLAVGVPLAMLSHQRSKRLRERRDDLEETHKAMVEHYNAMDKILADATVSDEIKLTLFAVTRSLGNRDIAVKACHELVSQKGFTGERSGFSRAVDAVRETRPDLVREIETAMSSSLFIMMLRWPETSKRFKDFVIASMMNENREITVFSRVSKVARDNGAISSEVKSVFADGACAA
ncbi:hypothetical protein [Sinorhizobium saheli]|uniref:Uncharacterized protein n=1 Tax=Sinorhizobium saheli TaxID=36856 RepID=A0A178XVD2_SINSA|nr:hypothetical protein [Sinorhizobium saheli]MQW88559.1 hypothetical protein [Sinorhizobium saheli]OAP39270.1 hypothetical protein ATB98_02965 [Sinorhizobium saheli]